MSALGEPLQQWVLDRIATTRDRMSRTRMVDMPAASESTLVGTLSIRSRLAPPPVTCVNCGVAFKRRRPTQKYCDADCYMRYWKQRGATVPGQRQKLEPGVCPNCKITFRRKDSQHKYCSRKCYLARWMVDQGPRMRAKALLTDTRPVEPSDIRRVVDIVADVYGVPQHVLAARTRVHAVSHPRHVAMALAADILGADFKAIGRVLGLHRTSVVHGYKQTHKRVEKDPAFAALYEDAEARARAFAQQSPAIERAA